MYERYRRRARGRGVRFLRGSAPRRGPDPRALLQSPGRRWHSQCLEVLDQGSAVGVGSNSQPNVVAAISTSGTRSVEPVAIVAEPAQPLRFVELDRVGIGIERLTEALTVQPFGRHD